MEPQDTKLSISEKWFGPGSLGGGLGEPTLFLYFGGEVERTYTVSSLLKELNSWGWLSRVNNHDARIALVGADGDDPLETQYSEEIENLLTVLQNLYSIRSEKIQPHTSGLLSPPDSVDRVVDDFVVVLDTEIVRDVVDGGREVGVLLENYPRRTPDVIVRHNGGRDVREYIDEFTEKFLIPSGGVWLYPEDEFVWSETLGTAKSLGCRVCLPPNYFREVGDE